MDDRREREPAGRLIRWRTAIVGLWTDLGAEQVSEWQAIRARLFASDRSRRSELELTTAALLALRGKQA